MDVALAIEALLPSAEYFGSTTPNSKDCFDNLNWFDKRPKPTWQAILDGYENMPNEIKNPISKV